MSNALATLAEQFGASEALVRRSAEARASALGSTADEVLAAWSGGAPPPAPVQPEPAPPQPAPEIAVPQPDPESTAVEAEVSDGPPDELETGAPTAHPAPAQPPVVEPEPIPSGSLGSLIAGSVVLFVIMLVATVIAPSSTGNAQTLDAVANLELSADALRGRDVYLAEGCSFCHTQQVRAIVTDADLGIVTLSESPLVPGVQRIGPDLTHVGGREPTDSSAWLSGYLAEPEAFIPDSRHASFGYMSQPDLQDLIAYLLESK